MSRTGLESEFEDMALEYLRTVDLALGKLSPSRRAELVGEITLHLADLRSEYPVHNRSEMQNLLDRVGRPADIAAAALEDDDGVSVPFFRRRTTTIVVVLAVVLLASLGTALALINSPGNSRPCGHAPAVVTVPNLVGMSEAQAEASLQAVGLTGGNVQTAPSPTVGPGVVLAQAPQAGSRMPTGSAISLTVSAGPPRSTGTTSQITTELPRGNFLDGGGGAPRYDIA